MIGNLNIKRYKNNAINGCMTIKHNINRFHSKNKQFFGYQMIDESLSWLRSKLRYGENPTDNSKINAKNG